MSQTEAEFESQAMAMLMGSTAETNGSDATNGAPAPTAKPKRARADAQLGLVDEHEDAAEEGANAEAADDGIQPEGDATAAQDNDTGEEFAAEAEPNNSLNDEQEQEQEQEQEGENALPKGVRAKLSKQSAKIERLEAAMEELQAKNAELETKAVDPVAQSRPVTDAEVKLSGELENFRARRAKVNEGLRQAMATGAERVTVKLDGQEPVELSVAEAEEALEQLGDKMADRKDDLRTLRREREGKRQRIDELLNTSHPWTKDRKHPATAALEAELRRYPALRDIPEARYWIASTMALEDMVAARRKANGNGNGNGHAGQAASRPAGQPAAPAPRPPARATRPGAAPMAVNGARASLNGAQARFAKSGDDTSGKELVAALLAT